MFLKNFFDIAKANIKRFFENPEKWRLKERESVADKKEADVLQSREFLEILKIFHQRSMQSTGLEWIEIYEIAAETHYKVTVVYPILTWMMTMGLLEMWVYDEARRSYKLNQEVSNRIYDRYLASLRENNE